MSFPLVFGPNNTLTLLTTDTAVATDISTLQLVPPASLVASVSTTPNIGYIKTDPRTGTIYASALATLLYSQATNKWYRRVDTTTTPGSAYEQITPYITCSAYSTAGNVHATNTNLFYDFPTTEFNVGGGTILGAGGGINATYTNTWRYQPPQQGYYLVNSILEWDNVPASLTQTMNTMVYTSGTITAYGINGPANNGATMTRTSMQSHLVRLTSNTQVISISAQFNASAPISQSTSGPSNKVTISYVGWPSG